MNIPTCVRVYACFVVGVAVAMTARVSSADITGTWTQDPNTPNLFYFEYEVTGLPDFDQRRDTLANCGVNFCVPTAAMNILAYGANHGFPELVSGPNNWFSPSSYAQVSADIAAVAGCMATDAGTGTTQSGKYFGLVGCPFIPLHCSALGLCSTGQLPPEKFTVSLQLGSGEYGPRAYSAIKSAIQHKGLVMLGNGWYEPFGNFWCGSSRVVYRNGGHAQTVQKVSGHWLQGSNAQSGYGGKIWLRDPGSDEGWTVDPSPPCNAINPQAQSAHVSHEYTFDIKTVPIDSFTCTTRRFERITFTGDEELRLVDSYTVIIPKGAYAFTDGPPTFHLHHAHAFNASGPTTQSWPLPVAVPVVDFSMSPDQDTYAVVADSLVHIFDPLVQSLTPLNEANVDLVEPTAVVFGRQRGLYVVDAGTIVCINMDMPLPTEVIRVAPPNPCTVLLYNDVLDEVVAISQPTASIMRYGHTLEEDPILLDIPGTVPLDGTIKMAMHPDGAQMWVMNTEHPELYLLTPDPDAGLIATSFALPAVQAPPSAMDVDDAGHIFLAIEGAMHEFVISPLSGDLVEVTDSPFAGRPAGSLLKMTHSRTNFDPALHLGAEWDDVIPTQSAPIADECAADLNNDDAVNVVDLLQVLGGWGPCAPQCNGDANLDGVVNVLDLLLVLSEWGPCPSTEPLILGDDCQAAPLVREGSYAFSNIGTDTDGPPLPGPCNEGSGLSLEHDMWLLYIPTANGTATISTCGAANFDTRMAAYAGTCDTISLIACNDDAPGCGLASVMQFSAFIGQPVMIRIGGYNGAEGTGTVTISVQ